MDGTTSATMAMLMGPTAPAKKKPAPPAPVKVKPPPPASAPPKDGFGGKPQGTSGAGSLPVGEAEGGTRVVKASGCRMALPFTIQLGAARVLTDAEAAKVAKDAQLVWEPVFERAKRTFSPEKYNPESEVARINALKEGQTTQVSTAMYDVLEAAGTLHRATRGLFDPTVETSLSHWEAQLSATGAPPDLTDPPPAPGGETPLTARSGITWANAFALGADDAGFWLKKLRGPARIDLSGLAKGWAVDALVEELAALSKRHPLLLRPPSVYAEWGGDLRTEGRHPEGRPWVVAVDTPPALPDIFDRWLARQCGAGGKSEAAAAGCPQAHAFRCESTALATSGDYGTPWRYGYFPVLNPLLSGGAPQKAGRCAAAVTVETSGSCMYADGLATALMCLGGAREAAEWLEKLKLEAGDRGGGCAARQTVAQQVLRYCVQDRGAGGSFICDPAATGGAGSGGPRSPAANRPRRMISETPNTSSDGSESGPVAEDLDDASPTASGVSSRTVLKTVPHQVFILRDASKNVAVPLDSVAVAFAGDDHAPAAVVFNVQRNSLLSRVLQELRGGEELSQPTSRHLASQQEPASQVSEHNQPAIQSQAQTSAIQSQAQTSTIQSHAQTGSPAIQTSPRQPAKPEGRSRPAPRKADLLLYPLPPTPQMVALAASAAAGAKPRSSILNTLLTHSLDLALDQLVDDPAASGDHCVAICSVVNPSVQLPPASLLSASRPSGRYYLKATAKLPTPMAAVVRNGRWVPVMHLNSLSARPPLVQFVACSSFADELRVDMAAGGEGRREVTFVTLAPQNAASAAQMVGFLRTSERSTGVRLRQTIIPTGDGGRLKGSVLSIHALPATSMVLVISSVSEATATPTPSFLLSDHTLKINLTVDELPSS
ncbi:FAD:protein FMN transferase [Diplonema papillatum]|nr:FAD:protein FMN transferase [Diplonema papillatum]